MTDNTTAPLYALRAKLIGWRDMQHALDYLFADGTSGQERWWLSTLRKC
jgi:hypothetical protein